MYKLLLILLMTSAAANADIYLVDSATWGLATGETMVLKSSKTNKYNVDTCKYVNGSKEVETPLTYFAGKAVCPKSVAARKVIFVPIDFDSIPEADIFVGQ